jgi:hypothetical protein
MQLDFLTHWMITLGVGALCLVAATILMFIDRHQSRKRRH